MTKLYGPWDDIPSPEKTRIQVGIPKLVQQRWFHQLLPAWGSQDKVLARLFYGFVKHAETHHKLIPLNPLNEQIVNNILNSQTFEEHEH